MKVGTFKINTSAPKTECDKCGSEDINSLSDVAFICNECGFVSIATITFDSPTKTTMKKMV